MELTFRSSVPAALSLSKVGCSRVGEKMLKNKQKQNVPPTPKLDPRIHLPRLLCGVDMAVGVTRVLRESLILLPPAAKILSHMLACLPKRSLTPFSSYGFSHRF